MTDKGFFRREKPLVIAVPSSVLDTEPNLREKTVKVAFLLRCSAIFRVNELIIYNDPLIPAYLNKRYIRLFRILHRYYLTPPYLRKKLVPLAKELRYVGVAPPLGLRIFDVSRSPKQGEYRIGLIEHVGNRVLANIGLDREVFVECKDPCPAGKLVVVKIVSENPVRAEYRSLYNKLLYTGPRLVVGDLIKIMERYRVRGYYVIATSRKGKVVDISAIEKLRKCIKSKKGFFVAFGAPRYGLYEIVEFLGRDLDELVDVVLNTIPNQGVKTVRTEEAVYASLALLNLIEQI